MLEIPATDTLSDEITARILDRLEQFRFLIGYAVMDVGFFAILLPIIESKRRVRDTDEKKP
jgi:hypothetical protein